MYNTTLNPNLTHLQIFDTNGGSEFKNYLIDDLLKKFHIKHSLSAKGCPYDNAVTEAQSLKQSLCVQDTLKFKAGINYLRLLD